MTLTSSKRLAYKNSKNPGKSCAVSRKESFASVNAISSNKSITTVKNNNISRENLDLRKHRYKSLFVQRNSSQPVSSEMEIKVIKPPLNPNKSQFESTTKTYLNQTKSTTNK